MKHEHDRSAAFGFRGADAKQSPETKGAIGALPAASLGILDLMHDAICVRNMGGVIEYWNHAAETLYGWPAEEVRGRVSHALLKTIFPDPLDRIEAELLRTGFWEGELMHMLRDESRVTVASRWTLLRDEVSRPVAILETNQDITERKRADAERSKLEENLRQAAKMEAIGRFASGIAHDFNNVLYGIIAYGEMLFDEAPENTDRKRYAQNVLAAATRGHELVGQILAYSRSQLGIRGSTDMSRALAETLGLLRVTIPPSIALETSIPDAPVVVVGQGVQLHQVAMNLCTNSIQAMSGGGNLQVALATIDVPAERPLSHGILKQGSWACLCVEDSGCGMDEATLARLFEPFFTTREASRGTGLGLALVDTIVTNLGGAIDVKSVPGQGSSFSIYIPMAATTHAAAL